MSISDNPQDIHWVYGYNHSLFELEELGSIGFELVMRDLADIWEGGIWESDCIRELILIIHWSGLENGKIV